MAPWNLSTRKITYKNNKILVNDKYELVFFHYSGFDSGANEIVFNYYVPDKTNYIYKLRDEYVKEMNENEQSSIGKYPWTYNCYFNGEPINRDIRRQYRDTKLITTIEENPFALSDNHLYKMMNPNEESSGNDDVSIGRKVFRKIVPLSVRKKLKRK